MIGRRLWWQLQLRRHGPLPWLALALFMIAAALQAAWLPRLAASLAAERALVARLDRDLTRPAAAAVAAPDAGTSLLQRRHQAFVAALAPAGGTTPLLEALFGGAAKHGLALHQAEYKWGTDAAGGYRTLEVRLPVKGAYPQIRRFVADTLSAMPAAALEEASFRREGVASASGEARLRFVFYLAEGAR